MSVGIVDSARRGQHGRLLAQGTFYSSALQVSDVAAVLSLVCVGFGSLWIAGLLYPVFTIGLIAGNAAAPFILGRSRHLKHLVFAGGTTAMAVLIACAAISAKNMWFIDAVFLIISAGLGIGKGISDGAHAELVSAQLPHQRRSELILSEGATSALIVVTTTLVVVPTLSAGNPSNGQLTVLWLGAAFMIVAAAASLISGPVRAHADAPIPGLRETFRLGLRVIRSERWFGRYVLTQLLFVPLGLGTMFYSLHAADRNGDTKATLIVVVVCTGAGMLVGSYLWRGIYRAGGVRGMLVTSSLMAVAAAKFCIFAHVLGIWPQTWACGLVFVIAVVSNQAVWASAIAWLGMFAPERDRPMLMGFGLLVVTPATSILGVLLGGIAPNVAAIWPVTIVLSLNAIAILAAVCAPSNA
jgi:hypothetical protein